jgi:hypothetical protein
MLPHISPKELMLTDVFDSFKHEARERVNQLLCVRVEDELELRSWESQDSSVYQQILQSLSTIAGHCLSDAVEAVLGWRRSETIGTIPDAAKLRMDVRT